MLSRGSYNKVADAYDVVHKVWKQSPPESEQEHQAAIALAQAAHAVALVEYAAAVQAQQR